jgi:hypothetical protein
MFFLWNDADVPLAAFTGNLLVPQPSINLYYSSILPYTWVIFFQISTIKSSRKVFTLQGLQH